MRVAVHGRAARVHLDVAGLDGPDLVEFARERVVQAHGGPGYPRATAGPAPPLPVRPRPMSGRGGSSGGRRNAAVPVAVRAAASRRRRARDRASTGRRRACSRCASQRRLVVLLHRLWRTPGPGTACRPPAAPCAPSMIASMSSPETVLWVSRRARRPGPRRGSPPRSSQVASYSSPELRLDLLAELALAECSGRRRPRPIPCCRAMTAELRDAVRGDRVAHGHVAEVHAHDRVALAHVARRRPSELSPSKNSRSPASDARLTITSIVAFGAPLERSGPRAGCTTRTRRCRRGARSSRCRSPRAGGAVGDDGVARLVHRPSRAARARCTRSRPGTPCCLSAWHG